jgi:hypothetical protein
MCAGNAASALGNPDSVLHPGRTAKPVRPVGTGARLGWPGNTAGRRPRGSCCVVRGGLVPDGRGEHAPRETRISPCRVIPAAVGCRTSCRALARKPRQGLGEEELAWSPAAVGVSSLRRLSFVRMVLAPMLATIDSYVTRERLRSGTTYPGRPPLTASSRRPAASEEG